MGYNCDKQYKPQSQQQKLLPASQKLLQHVNQVNPIETGMEILSCVLRSYIRIWNEEAETWSKTIACTEVI